MKVLVTPRSFGKNNPALFDQLTAKGLTVVRNDTGGILTEQQMCEKIADCAGLILGIDPVNQRVLDQAKELKAIAKYGVGTDNIDLEACQRLGIKVSRTVGANSNAVADYAFALMLACARRVNLIDRRCRQKDWGKITSIDLYGKTLGIVGLGCVGKCVAKRAQGFSMRVLAYDIYKDETYAKANNICYTDLDTLIAESDVITLHAALTPENHQMISKERLCAMKKTAILVNTARGDLVDEAALLWALTEGEIYAAGLDVFVQEPPTDPRWYTLDNLVMGSHCASSTAGATDTMGQMAVDNLLRDLAIA
ncbi:MAG: phosphoglycerate dehydrogenase [Desulfovibrio sp.]|nr:phosphoglycerate dehydrogenase [Desulfovibrio sp.]